MEVRALTCLVLTKRADSEGLGRKGERKRGKARGAKEEESKGPFTFENIRM